MNYRSIAEVAAMLGVSEKTLRGWVATGDVPSVKIRGRRLIDVDELEAQLEEQKEKEKGTCQ